MSGAFVDAAVGDSTRGVEFRLDWLALTFKRLSTETTLKHLASYLGEEWGPSGWELTPLGDQRVRGQGPSGALLEENLAQGWTHVQLKGEACGVIGTGTLLELCAASRTAFGDYFKATRVDVAWDDFEKRISPGQLRERVWVDRSRKQPGVKCKAVRSCERTNYGDALGGTFQLGSRSSTRILRWYDKEEESGGEVKSMRCELEVKGRFANALLRELLDAPTPREVVRVAVTHLVAFLDFRDPESGERAAWWAEFVGDAHAARVGRPAVSGLAEFLRRMLRQFGGAFLVLAQAAGGPERAAQLLVRLTDKPRNARHRRFIRDIQSGRTATFDREYVEHLSSMPLGPGACGSGAPDPKASGPHPSSVPETQPARDPQGS